MTKITEKGAFFSFHGIRYLRGQEWKALLGLFDFDARKDSFGVFDMKTVFGFWVLFMTVGAVLVFLSFSSSSSSSLEDLLAGNAGLAFPVHEENMKARMTNRKLKENGYDRSGSTAKKGGSGDLNLEDYHSIDPVPSSRASIKTGPIEHGTPLIPYIPQPTPPGHPKHGGFP